MRSRWLILGVCILAAISLSFFFLHSKSNKSPAEVSQSDLAADMTRKPTALASDLPKARALSENPFAPKEIPKESINESIFRDVRKKRAIPDDDLRPLLSDRRWEIRGNKYSLMEEAIGMDAASAPKGVRPVGEANGVLLYKKSDVEDVPGEKYLLLYEERFGRVVVLTGHVKVEADKLPALPGELSLVQEFPHINLYFLKTSASSYNELTERLALAQSLPGVRNAVLDLVESRFVPK